MWGRTPLSGQRLPPPLAPSSLHLTLPVLAPNSTDRPDSVKLIDTTHRPHGPCPWGHLSYPMARTGRPKDSAADSAAGGRLVPVSVV